VAASQRQLLYLTRTRGRDRLLITSAVIGPEFRQDLLG